MLVNCVAYQNGRKLADIPVEDISEYVSRPDCFVWVAINDPTDDEGMLARSEVHEAEIEQFAAFSMELLRRVLYLEQCI